MKFNALKDGQPFLVKVEIIDGEKYIKVRDLIAYLANIRGGFFGSRGQVELLQSFLDEMIKQFSKLDTEMRK